MYTRFHDFYPTGASSLTTSAAYLAADFGVISIEVGATSAVTLQGTNVEGFNVPIAEADWSNLSVIAAAGVFKVEPGFRFCRTIRTSSANTVRMSLVQRD